VRLVELESYAAVLAATGGAPLVRLEVGPVLIAPAWSWGAAVLLMREIQTGATGAVMLGPTEDVRALLACPWREQPGYEAVRGLTLERANRPELEAAGARMIGDWRTMAITGAELVPRPVPGGVLIDPSVPREAARAFVEEHYSSRWLAPSPPGEVWVGARDAASGRLLAVGMSALTPAGVPRLAGITVPASERGRGLGRQVTQALVQSGLSRHEVVTLGVDEDNVVGLGLYAAMGFRTTHEFSSGLLPSLPLPSLSPDSR